MIHSAISSAELCRADADVPRFVFHDSFEEVGAEDRYHPEAAPLDLPEHRVQYMPDDVTRECARRMHYAAYRQKGSADESSARWWREQYFVLRDRIILGNRKLVFRAVRQRTHDMAYWDDLVSECYLVLLRAVAMYNPWLEVRFSTYAFTCLSRALVRLGGRIAADRLCKSLSLESLAEREPASTAADLPARMAWQPLDDYLREEHPLLSSREKLVLERRYRLSGPGERPTLERVGKELGISKERVRQLQASAVEKLRRALLGDAASDEITAREQQAERKPRVSRRRTRQRDTYRMTL